VETGLCPVTTQAVRQLLPSDSLHFLTELSFPLRYNAGMRRWSCIAAVSLMVMAMPLWAQRHGGGGGGGFGSHGVSAGHSSLARSSAGQSSAGRSYSGRPYSVRSSSAVRGGSFGRNSSGVRVRTGNPYSRGFYGRRGYNPYVGYYPYGYSSWYADPLYDTNDQDAYAGEYNAAPDADDTGTQRDLDQLNGKVDRLQQDVAARNRPKPDPEPATALVFRDQHVEEVHNYAISGGVVWVLNDQAGKKIPLAELDIPATVKMNDDRGVDFQVPGPSLQIMIMN
jgi:hypothetical protein